MFDLSTRGIRACTSGARTFNTLALTAALTAATTAFAADPGITDTEVLLGASVPQSGPNAGYGVIGAALKGCFDYLNTELGGVKFGDGKTRKVRIEMLDDAMEPARAVQNARRLVSQLNVFATVANMGTGANLGSRSYYNAEKVPQVFIGSGGPMFGANAEVEKNPWSMLGYLSYNTEAAVYAEFIKQKFPNAKIALLNDDSGGPFFADTFLKTAKALGLNVVAHEEHSYSEPTINAKVSRLAASGADLYVEATTPKFVVQSIKQMAAIDWKPVHIVWGVGASVGGVFEPAGVDISKGIYSGLWLKDPTNPAFANDADMKTYFAKLKQYASNVNASDLNAAAGWYICHGSKAVMERMTAPTRDAFMASIRSMSNVKIPMLLDGITFTTSGVTDGYPIESVQIAQFDGVKFVPVGGIINYEGRTPLYEPRVKPQ